MKSPNRTSRTFDLPLGKVSGTQGFEEIKDAKVVWIPEYERC
jgi:hypothetical protein